MMALMAVVQKKKGDGPIWSYGAGWISGYMKIYNGISMSVR